MQKGFFGVIVYLGMSYLLGLLSQLGREHAKDIAHSHNKGSLDRRAYRDKSRRSKRSERVQREFIPETGKINGRQENSTKSTRPYHQDNEGPRS